MLLFNSIILLTADNCKEGQKELNSIRALLIGVSQAIGIIPGISRSGATIALAILLKIDREKAAKFSFLMVIPLIFGSMAKSILLGELSQDSMDLLHVLVGFFSAFFTGVFACRWMITMVKKSQL